jgi:hypothetical protein
MFKRKHKNSPDFQDAVTEGIFDFVSKAIKLQKEKNKSAKKIAKSIFNVTCSQKSGQILRYSASEKQNVLLIFKLTYCLSP